MNALSAAEPRDRPSRPDTSRRSRSDRGHRIGLVKGLTMAVGVMIVLAGCSLRIDPAEGPPNTPYKVSMLCLERPTLYGRPLADYPPPTQVPKEIQQVGPSQWTYDAVSSHYDDQYFALCGSNRQSTTVRHRRASPLSRTRARPRFPLLSEIRR